MVLLLYGRIPSNLSRSPSATSGGSEIFNTAGFARTLATTHSPTLAWDLPLRSDSYTNQQLTTAPPLCDDSENKQLSLNHLGPETNTSSCSPIDRSSSSSLSITTMRSEKSLSPNLNQKNYEDNLVAEIEPKAENFDATAPAGLKSSDTSDGPRDIATDPSRRRKRGRPLKNSAPSRPPNQLKTTGMRSKTGCLTCRKRKKKCDEAKPVCMSCKKNAIFCEGYREIQFWKSGKIRSEEAEARRYSFPGPAPLPPIVEGVETEVDRHLFAHFCDLIGVYTLHDDDVNPFKDFLLPMATRSQHKGLLHSLMALSASHISQHHSSPKFEQRRWHHFATATSMTLAAVKSAAHGNEIDDATMASTIIYLLISITDGSINGEYRKYLDGAQNLFSRCKSQDPRIQQFIGEFSLYHAVLNSLTSLDRRPLDFDADYERFLESFMGCNAQESLLVGVVHGLFRFLWQITNLRDIVRARRNAGLEPTIDSNCLSQAIAIDAGIRDWDSQQELNTSHWLVAQIFRQFTWVYLYRTMEPSKPGKRIFTAVNDGINYFRAVSPNDSAQCILLAPVFILSCAAFENSQRLELEEAFETLQRYSNLGNIKRARQVVSIVWELMDAGDERSWDWEAVMAKMNYDSLFT